MSSREVDIDALFDRDADGQLLERRRRDELGLKAQAGSSSSSASSFGAESIVGDRAAEALRPASLRLEIDARPARELIPGAVVTVVAALHDDGDAPVPDATVRLALPADAEPIAGSFTRDDIAIDGAALLGDGLRIGSIAGGAAVRLRFTMRILPGAETLDIVAHVNAPGVPVIAAPTLRLQRRANHTAYAAPRPFFEVEPGEAEDDDDLRELIARDVPEPVRTVDTTVSERAMPTIAPAPAAPVAAVPTPAAPAPVVPAPPPPPPPPPQPVAAAAPPPPAPAPPPPPAPAPAAPSLPAAVLARPFSLDDLRALERMFAGEVPHGLAAMGLLVNVASTGGAFADAVGLEAFRAAIAAQLPRALVAARMGRPPGAVVSDATLALLHPDAPAAAADAAAAFREPTLVTRLDGRENAALRTVLARQMDDPFLRGVQVLLAAAPRSLNGVADGAPVAGALAAYRSGASAWLMRTTVRRALDRKFDPLTAQDEALQAAGRALLVTLRNALSA
jgi:hypothetical protein